MKNPLRFLLRISLTQWIFIALVAGFAMGVWTPRLVPVIAPFRDLFLNGIKCLIAPLLFSTIVTGVAGAGDTKQLGKMGFWALVYFEVVTSLALVVGLFAVNIFKPGMGLQIGSVVPDAVSQAIQNKISFGSFVGHLLPHNIAEAVVNGDVLQIVILTLVFATATLAMGERAKPIVIFCESLSQVMFKFTAYIMYLAPLGVGAAIASSVADHGWQIVFPFMKLLGTFYGALIVFYLCILIPICKIFGVPVGAFFKQMKDPFVLAFGTASSEAAFPSALARLESFGIPRRIASFILPLGYSFNLDGSTLYLSLASVFIAQAAGIHMSLGQQLLMMLTLILTTKGVAAVPRASIVILSGTAATFGLPLEGVALLLGVDVFMDMGRTATNLLGNCLATAVMARTQGVKLPGPPEDSEPSVV